MRMDATSIPSWMIAPATGPNRPKAANPMNPNDRPMPMSTACRAIPFERRAMKIASTRTSRRSTISTTSAASDDAVAPRAARATPTSAAASAGASFKPSPTMIVTPSPLGPIAATFSAGALAQHGIDADDPSDGLGDVGGPRSPARRA